MNSRELFFRKIRTTTKFLTIKLETKVNSDRTDRRAVPDTEPNAPPDLTQADIAHTIVHITGVKKPNHTQILGHWHTKFAVEDNNGVATLGKSPFINRRTRQPCRYTQPVEGITSHRGVTTRKKALANRKERTLTIRRNRG
jgi:hypothetical protein